MSQPANPGVHHGPLPVITGTVRTLGFEKNLIMATSHLHILPSEDPVPSPVPIPLDNARRWYSHDEEPGFNPLYPVFVTQGAYFCVVMHSASDMECEVGGLLVGNWSIDTESQQQFIVVEAVLPARYTRQGTVYLTFTQDSLVDLHAEMDEHYPGKQIVGWYHTHPGMGVFLSPHDAWLHQHFFPEPWQVALVIEPHSATGGFFIHQADGVLDPGRYFGFYELDGNPGQSIVHWNNLHEESETAKTKGVDLNE